MSTPDDEDDALESVGIGPIETGVPLPRKHGFLGRLRLSLERLEVGNSVQLLNVTFKQEKYIRARVPLLGTSMQAKYSVRVVGKERDRSGKRALRIHRVE